ncbi:hypothetical protein M514_12688 [Trichuris suis]|uniref:Peptidase aspartic putative domain-containing protein n=1 Tax=Trichuris suis TaxID=68888 RepID=A0A085MSJ7_9BILA|nr:hypothetical protein M514_12688 [Trichuris suis]
MDTVEPIIASTESATGALKSELCQENPVHERIQRCREQLVQLLLQGERLKTLRSSALSLEDWDRCAKLAQEQVSAADDFLQQNYLSSVSSAGSHSNSPGTQPRSGWEKVEKDGKRHLQQILVAMESTDFSVPLDRNRLKLRIQHATGAAMALREWFNDVQLDEEIRFRLEELSIELDAVVMTATERLSLQGKETKISESGASAKQSTLEGTMMGASGNLFPGESIPYRPYKISASAVEQKSDPCSAEPFSASPHGAHLSDRDISQSLTSRRPFDLAKDGGDLISAILGQKAEEQVPIFSGEPEEYPAWEEAIAPIRFCSFRQPIMKFNAIKKSLRGEALDIVKWIGMDQPNRVEALVDALKREYGRADIVIRAQEVRLDKLEPPKEDDYPSLRNFVIAVRSCLATMKAHGHNVENNPQFTRQLERKLNWTLIKRWCQKGKGETPIHLLEFLEAEADILQKAHLFKLDVAPMRRVLSTAKSKESALVSVESSKEKHDELKNREREPSTDSSSRGCTGGVKCPKCSGKHSLTNCNWLVSLLVGMRLAEAKRFGVHCPWLSKHKLNGSCSIPLEKQRFQTDPSCKYRHRELLHPQPRGKARISNRHQEEKGYVYNDTADHLELLRAFVRGPKKTVLTTALIDSGCSRTFVDEDLAKKLGLKVKTSQVLCKEFTGKKRRDHYQKRGYDILGSSGGRAVWMGIRRVQSIEL